MLSWIANSRSSQNPHSQDALGIAPRVALDLRHVPEWPLLTAGATICQDRCILGGYAVRWVRVQGAAAAGAFQQSNSGIIRMIGICRRCRQRYTVSASDAKCMVSTYVMRRRDVPKLLPGICDKCWAKMLVKHVPP
jgi:hypothetical protein